MIRLKNNTGTFSKIGYAVTTDPRDKDAFIYALPNATKILGIITESVAYRKRCNVATQGDTAKVFVVGNVVKGNAIRLSKTTDRASLGSSVIVESGDSPYLKIGDALDSGRGLVSCVLELSYNSVATNTQAVAEYADNAAALAAGLKIGEFYRTGDDLKIVH